MFRKRSKAHQHILYISQYIERRNLIASFGGWVGVGVVVVVVGGGGGVCVCVCVWGGGGGGGGTLGGCISLRRFIHFYLRKKLESKILWKEFGLL